MRLPPHIAALKNEDYIFCARAADDLGSIKETPHIQPCGQTRAHLPYVPLSIFRILRHEGSGERLRVAVLQLSQKADRPDRILIATPSLRTVRTIRSITARKFRKHIFIL